MISLKELNALMIHGQALQKFEDPAILYEIASRGKTYVEIGTRWGGSAIVAGLAGCKVYCIDPWEYPGKPEHRQTRPIHVIDNWRNAGLDPRKLFLYKQRHPPWPFPQDWTFDIGMIDGGHHMEQCKKDWEEMRLHVTKYILFHDIHKPSGSTTSPGYVFAEAAQDPKWDTVEIPVRHQYGILKHAP